MLACEADIDIIIEWVAIVTPPEPPRALDCAVVPGFEVGAFGEADCGLDMLAGPTGAQTPKAGWQPAPQYMSPLPQ